MIMKKMTAYKFVDMDKHQILIIIFARNVQLFSMKGVYIVVNQHAINVKIAI